MTRILVLTTALLVLGAPLLSAQSAADPAQRIEQVRQRAAATGIPVSLIDSKVAEGVAKGVPMDRIAAAVESRFSALSRARAVMNLREGEWTPADLSVGADALQEGVSEDALRAISRAAPADQRAVAIAVLTHLVQQGDAIEQALAQVQGALQRGPEALRNLPAEAAATRERRGPPQERGRPPGAGNQRGNQGSQGNRGVAAGRRQGGPPSAVPAPGRRPGSENPNKGKGRQNNPNKRGNNPGNRP